jgi:ArsR family transcriptional regulator
MGTATARQPEALLSWMGGLADPTRLRLLRVLERQELGVAELCDVLQLPQSTVSRHLKTLAGQGWVTSRSQRTNNLYRMAGLEKESAERRLWLLAREQTDGWATVRQDQLRLERVLAARVEGAQAFFAGAAGEWDRLRAELYGGGFTAAAIGALLPPDWVVADLACGTGHAAAALATDVRRVIGVDQSAAMLKAARRRTAGLGNVDLRQGALESLPIEDGACDGALLLIALTYVDEPAVVAGELARVLKPGGRAVVVDLLRHDREDFREAMGQRRPGFEPEELSALLAAAGFDAPRARALPPEPDAKGPALVLAAATRAAAPSVKLRKGDDAR